MPEPQLHALREALRELQRGRGERGIADTLGVNRKTWRRIADRLGLPPEPVGRRRGDTTMIVLTNTEPTTLELVGERRARWSARHVPATIHTLDVAHAALHAVPDDEPNAYDDTLIDIAAAALLIHDHRQQLRRAA